MSEEKEGWKPAGELKDSPKFIDDTIKDMIKEYKTMYKVKENEFDDNLDTEEIIKQIKKILDDKFNGILGTRYKGLLDKEKEDIKQKMKEEKPRK